MGLVDLASGNSVWRGYDYYEARKVLSYEKTGEFQYDGRVSGSENNIYDVHIDKEHPRRSTCNCPFAEGRRVICKHMIAVYFTAEPEAADNLIRMQEEWEAEEERLHQERIAELDKYVKSLTKKELQALLLQYMIEEEEDDYWRG